MAKGLTKIIIADDHPVMAMGVERLLVAAGDIEVVAVVHNVRDFLRRAEEEWDVAVLDLNLDDGSGLELLDQMRARFPERRVIIYSVAPVEQMAMISMSRGASAYISKNDSPNLLLQAVEHARLGRRFVTPEVADLLVEGGTRTRVLTHREIELIQLLSSGVKPSGIADQLHITRATVSGHLASARKKLGARSNVELVRLFEQGVN